MSKTIITGGPFHPVPGGGNHHDGASVRVYLIGQVLSGLCANVDASAETIDLREIAETAINIVDETLEILEKEGGINVS